MAGIFLGGLVQLGSFGDIRNNLKIRVMTAYPGHILLQISTAKLVFQNFIFHLISFNAFRKFLRLGNSAWDFFSVFFLLVGEGEIFGPRIFLGFDFCPHSIIPVN